MHGAQARSTATGAAEGRAPRSIVERIEETEDRKARLEAQREEYEVNLAADEAVLPSPEEIHRNFVQATQDFWPWVDPGSRMTRTSVRRCAICSGGRSGVSS